MKYPFCMYKSFPAASDDSGTRSILATDSKDLCIRMGLNINPTIPGPKRDNSQHSLSDQCVKELQSPIKATNLAKFAMQLANY